MSVSIQDILFLLYSMFIYCILRIIQDARRLATLIPAARMGMFTHCILKLNWLIKTENMQPLMGQNLIPLCSTQYKLLFGTTRIPGKTMGKELYVYFTPCYIIVAYTV